MPQVLDTGKYVKIGICRACGRYGHILKETKECINYANLKRVDACKRIVNKRGRKWINFGGARSVKAKEAGGSKQQ